MSDSMRQTLLLPGLVCLLHVPSACSAIAPLADVFPATRVEITADQQPVGPVDPAALQAYMPDYRVGMTWTYTFRLKNNETPAEVVPPVSKESVVEVVSLTEKTVKLRTTVPDEQPYEESLARTLRAIPNVNPEALPQLIGVGPVGLEYDAYQDVMHIRLADKSERWYAKGMGLIKQVSLMSFMGRVYETTKELKTFSAGP